MSRILLFLVVISIVSSCSRPTGIKDLVQGADSVAINFFKGDGTMDTVVKVMILKDKKQVEEITGFIEGGKIEDLTCGHDGSIHFFKQDMVLKDVDFRMNDKACMHFSFMMGNKLFSTGLSADAKAFFEKFKK